MNRKYISYSVLTIFVVLVGYFLFKFFLNNGNVTLSSHHPTLFLSKTDKYTDFSNYLSEVDFWRKGKIATTNGKGFDTAKKLTIDLSNQPQNGSLLYINGIDKPISSYTYFDNNGSVLLTLYIDNNSCKLPSCDVDVFINKQIVKAIYEATHSNNYSNDTFTATSSKYSGIYFSTKSGGAIKQFLNLFSKIFEVKTAYAADCHNWICKTSVTSCDPVTQVCTTSCTLPQLAESDNSCGSGGCPPGYCGATSDVNNCPGCSGTGGTATPAPVYAGCAAGGSPHPYNPPIYKCTNNCSGNQIEVGTCGPGDTKVQCEMQYCQVTCPSGTTFQCGSPPVYTCTRVGGCPYPGLWFGALSCSSDTSAGLCQTNCSCVSLITPAPSCVITAPTLTSISRDSATSATIRWTPGTAQAGSYQNIFISQDPNQVNQDCTLASNPGCVVNIKNLPTTQNSYSTGNVLAAGSVYYIRVVNYVSPSCYHGTNGTNTYNAGLPFPYLSSCTLTPSTLSLQISESATITSIIDSSLAVDHVDFISNNPSAVTVTSPANDYPYKSTATAVSNGIASISSNAYFAGGYIACTNVAGGNGTLSGGGTNGVNTNGGGGSSTGGSSETYGGGGSGSTGSVSITSNNLSSAWWQLQDSDITSNGSLSSIIPTGNVFILDGSGGSSGVPTYQTTTNLNSTNVSTDQWLTQNDNQSKPIFDYAYFENLIPKDVVFNTVSGSSVACSTFASGGTSSYGYYWYKYDGGGGSIPLHITNGCNIGNRKVVLMVKNADLDLDSSLNLNDGLGFFMAVVNKSIKIDPTVGGGVGPNLEGFYIADDTLDTGTGTNSLHIRGAVVAYGGITMGRDLGTGNLTKSAELFEYGPDQVIAFPQKLASRKISWKEVAP